MKRDGFRQRVHHHFCKAGRCVGAGLSLVMILAANAGAVAAPAFCGPVAFGPGSARPFGRALRPLACAVYVLHAPHMQLMLAVAATPGDRERGLMDVTDLPRGVGMLFVFAETGSHTFWMKDTLVPLDMVHFDANGTVTSVAPNVPASKKTTADDRIARRTGTGKFVLELRAGEAAAAGLHAGVRVDLHGLPSAT